MLDKINVEHLLFLDIETVPENKDFDELSTEKQQLFEQKTSYQRKEEFTAEDFYNRAGIWAEFGKIICISCGFFKHKDIHRQFRLRTFSGDESQLLRDFADLVNTHFHKPFHLLCAHNGKEFDFPFIARRMIINNIPIPVKLDLFGKKPWEVPHLDTMEMWKFGDYKHYTSLKLLTNVLGIESPKGDIDGADVRDVFYIDNQLGRIISYCERDVVAIAQIILRMRQEKLLESTEIIQVQI